MENRKKVQTRSRAREAPSVSAAKRLILTFSAVVGVVVFHQRGQLFQHDQWCTSLEITSPYRLDHIGNNDVAEMDSPLTPPKSLFCEDWKNSSDQNIVGRSAACQRFWTTWHC